MGFHGFPWVLETQGDGNVMETQGDVMVKHLKTVKYAINITIVDIDPTTFDPTTTPDEQPDGTPPGIRARYRR